MKISLFAFIIFFVLSCKKDKNTYTITGRIVQDCGLAFYANKVITLEQYKRKSLFSGKNSKKSGTLDITTTDQFGQFTFQYVGDASNGQDLFIRNVQSDFFDSKKNINAGLLYLNNIASIFVKIKIVNTFTSSDTLKVYGIPGINEYSMNGPFYDTVFGNFTFATQATPASQGELSKKHDKTKVFAGKYIIKGANGFFLEKELITPVIICGSIADSVTFRID